MFLFVFLQSSLAAARAENFNYPPEWTPDQVYVWIIVFENIVFWSDFQILTSLCFAGFFEQVPWSICFKGKSKENRPGYFDYKVIKHTRLNYVFVSFFFFGVISNFLLHLLIIFVIQVSTLKLWMLGTSAEFKLSSQIWC